MSSQPNAKPREIFLARNNNEGDRPVILDLSQHPDSLFASICEGVKYIEFAAFEELKNNLDIVTRTQHGQCALNDKLSEQNSALLAIIKKLTEMGEFYGAERNYQTSRTPQSGSMYLMEKLEINKKDSEEVIIDTRNKKLVGGQLARATLATVADELKKIGVVL